MIGGLYKLLTKVLTNKLKRAVGKVVFDIQHAFVERGQILGTTLIANEAIDSRLKSSTPKIICKLDIEKAYDHCNWSFFWMLWRIWVLGKSGLVG